MKKEAAFPEGLLGALRESAVKFRRRQLAASFFLLAAGATMLIAGLLSSPGGDAEKGMDAVTFLRYCGAALILSWLLSVFLITRNARSRMRVVESLERDTSALVWFYLEEITTAPGGVNLALRPHFNLADGTHAWFQVEKGTAREIFQHLEKNREDLSLGYSHELKRRFRSDPRSLAVSPERSEEVLRRRLTYLFRS